MNIVLSGIKPIALSIGTANALAPVSIALNNALPTIFLPNVLGFNNKDMFLYAFNFCNYTAGGGFCLQQNISEKTKKI